MTRFAPTIALGVSLSLLSLAVIAPAAAQETPPPATATVTIDASLIPALALLLNVAEADVPASVVVSTTDAAALCGLTTVDPDTSCAATATADLLAPFLDNDDPSEEPPVSEEPTNNSAAAFAPGHLKSDGESARTYAPGHNKGDGKSAKDNAPGQLKKNNNG